MWSPPFFEANESVDERMMCDHAGLPKESDLRRKTLICHVIPLVATRFVDRTALFHQICRPVHSLIYADPDEHDVLLLYWKWTRRSAGSPSYAVPRFLERRRFTITSSKAGSRYRSLISLHISIAVLFWKRVCHAWCFVSEIIEMFFGSSLPPIEEGRRWCRVSFFSIADLPSRWVDEKISWLLLSHLLHYLRYRVMHSFHFICDSFEVFLHEISSHYDEIYVCHCLLESREACVVTDHSSPQMTYTELTPLIEIDLSFPVFFFFSFL